jgi:hypothetical protein
MAWIDDSDFTPLPYAANYYLCSVSSVHADLILFIEDMGQYLLGFDKRKIVKIKKPMIQVALGYTDLHQYNGVICAINSTYSIFTLSKNTNTKCFTIF